MSVPKPDIVLEKAFGDSTPAAKRKAAMREEVYTFQFAHTDPRGHAWSGTFRSLIPDLDGRARIGALRANYNRGVLNMDPETDEMNARLAALEIGLAKEGRPEWAKDLTKLRVPSVITALWAEVSEHERTFLG